MALYHKWGVKNGLTPQFLLLNSHGLGGVNEVLRYLLITDSRAIKFVEFQETI